VSRVAELTNAHYGLDAPAVVIGNAVGGTAAPAGAGTAATAGAGIGWAAVRRRHRLPFEDPSFDVVVSSLAVHSIPGAPGRAATIGEIRPRGG
jgi:hypothetical protein